MNFKFASYFIISLALTGSVQRSWAQYCTYNLYSIGCDDGDYIDDFALSDFSHTETGCNSDSGYANYTSQTINMEQGGTYNLEINCGYQDQYISAWIDFDHDFVFEDGEKILTDLYCESANVTYSGAVFIPVTAATGTHRLRVRGVYNHTGFDPCLKYSYGEVHDYSVNITPATTPMQFVSAHNEQTNTAYLLQGEADAEILSVIIETTGNATPFAVTSFTINSNGSTAFSEDVTQVRIYSTGLSSTFSTGDLFGSAPGLDQPLIGNMILMPGKNYFWITYTIASTAAIGNQLDGECTLIKMNGSGGEQAPDNTAPPGYREINYCIPVIDNGCTDGDYINSVYLESLVNENSGCSDNDLAYTNFSPDSGWTTTMEFDSVYTLTIERGMEYPQGLAAWLDANGDGDFGDEGEFLFASLTADTGMYSANIYIPNDTFTLGERRLRIRSVFYVTFNSADYCAQIGYGETEDYTVTFLQPSCDGKPGAGTVTAPSLNFCQDGTVIPVSVTNTGFDIGLNYSWEESADGMNWLPVPGATETTYEATLSESIYFRTITTCSLSGMSNVSDTLLISEVGTPAAPFASDTKHCGPGGMLLTATGSGTGIIDWYDAPTGGNKLGSGDEFQTPFLNNSTSFYAEEVVGYPPFICSGPRTQVDVLIYYPQILAGATGDAHCEGDTFTLEALSTGSGEYDYNWSPLLAGMNPPNGAGDSLTVPLTASTIFTLIASEISGECADTLSVPILVDPLPEVILSGLESTYLLSDTSIVMTGTPAGGTFEGPGTSGNIFNPINAGTGGPYLIAYTYTNIQGCSAVDTVYVSVLPPLGTDILLTGTFIHVYPNPTDGMIFISSGAGSLQSCTIEVWDLPGRTLWAMQIHPPATSPMEFDLKDLPPGTYALVVKTPDFIDCRKFVIH